MANVTDPPEGAAFTAVAYLGGTPPANAVVINDTAGSGMPKTIDGRYRTGGQFGVHLANSPAAGQAVVVDVSVAVNPGNGVQVSPSSLSFTSGNFSADQLVTVTPSVNGAVESGIKCHVRGGGSADADIVVVG